MNFATDSSFYHASFNLTLLLLTPIQLKTTTFQFRPILFLTLHLTITYKLLDPITTHQSWRMKSLKITQSQMSSPSSLLILMKFIFLSSWTINVQSFWPNPWHNRNHVQYVLARSRKMKKSESSLVLIHSTKDALIHGSRQSLAVHSVETKY